MHGQVASGSVGSRVNADETNQSAVLCEGVGFHKVFCG